MYTFKFVVCEGQSEETYVLEVDRLLREQSILVYFRPLNANGGGYSNICRKHVALNKSRIPPEKRYTFLDEDIYRRNLDDCLFSEEQKILYNLQFTHWNFEDFLALHCEDAMLEHWISVMRAEGHLEMPLKAEDHARLVHEHLFPDYMKGTLPERLCPFTLDKLKQAWHNHRNPDVPFKCAMLDVFAEYLLLGA